MSTSTGVEPETVGVGFLSGLALLLGLVILLWPGPLSLTDRVPFALVLLIPGILGAARVRRDLS